MRTTARKTKPRSDAWDADLTEAQRWQAYDLFRRSPWYAVAEWAHKEFGLRRAPGRGALYRWARRMRQDESARRIEQAVAARDEVGALAAAACQDDSRLIEAYKSMAADLAMRSGDADGARKFTEMALALADSQRRRLELDLKARAQETKDAALKLAREKFEAAEDRLKAVREALNAPKNADGGLSAETLKKIEEAAGLL